MRPNPLFPGLPSDNITLVLSSLSHDRNDETLEAKARWFQSLSLAERMELLCAFTDLALSANPALADVKNAQQAQGRIRILAAPRR